MTEHNDLPLPAVEAVEQWGLGFHTGCAVVHIARAGKKDIGYVPSLKQVQALTIEDLRAARWHLDREIANLERGG